jgi:hypothetical protein
LAASIDIMPTMSRNMTVDTMSDNILEGYVTERQFAAEHNISPRTVHRYRSQADGLPFVAFVGRIWINMPLARQWLDGRVRQPNPRRKSR